MLKSWINHYRSMEIPNSRSKNLWRLLSLRLKLAKIREKSLKYRLRMRMLKIATSLLSRTVITLASFAKRCLEDHGGSRSNQCIPYLISNGNPPVME